MGIYKWSSKIGINTYEKLEDELQRLTGLNDIRISIAGIEKDQFRSSLEQIRFQDDEIIIVEPLGGPMVNYYLDCSFFYLINKIGPPIKRQIPKWAGIKWQKAKYIPWIRLRK